MSNFKNYQIKKEPTTTLTKGELRKLAKQKKKQQKKRDEEKARKILAEMYEKRTRNEQRIDLLIRKFCKNSGLPESELEELKQWGLFLVHEVIYTRGKVAYEKGQYHEESREIDGVTGAASKAEQDLKTFDTFYKKVDPKHISFNPVWVERQLALQKERELLAASAASEVQNQNVGDLKTDANPPAHAEVAEVEVVPDTWEDVVLDTRAPDEVPDEWDAEL